VEGSQNFGRKKMEKDEKKFAGLKRDYLERKIFLKRQLIFLTEKEIEIIERDLKGLNVPTGITESVCAG
jgi:hypothetical protein